MCRRRRWRSGSAGPNAPCRGAAWTSPATSPSCCACSTSSTRPATRAGWTWPARRSGSPASSPSPPRNRRRAGCSLMLLNHARLPAGLDPEDRIVTLDSQDRGLWDTREIAEGVRVLQSALALQRPGRYQVEAAIAALHDDAASAEETDWPQILAWYDDLVALTDDPVRRDPAAVLGRAVAVGHVHGAAAGLRETDQLRDVIGDRHRWHAVRGHLHELGGDLPAAAASYAEAACRATNVAERDHLVGQAARARAAEQGRNSPLTERSQS